MKKLSWLVMFAGAGLLSTAEAAITFNPTFSDSSGEVWTSDRIGVINQAMSDWSASFADSYTISITFDFTASQSYLGQWAGASSYFLGDNVTPWNDTTHTIHFNKDYFSGANYVWWDPSPTTSTDLPSAAWDALSVARHELGHALGFTELYVENIGMPGERNYWTSHITGSTFDPGGLNVSLAAVDNLSHLADSGATTDFLMTPAIVNGQRRDISSLELNMLSESLGYTVVPEPYSALGSALGLAVAVMVRRVYRRNSPR